MSFSQCKKMQMQNQNQVLQVSSKASSHQNHRWHCMVCIASFELELCEKKRVTYMALVTQLELAD